MNDTALMDERAEAINRRIGRHIAKRDKLVEQMKKIEQAIDWQTRRIRELGQQRSVELTFHLPGMEL